MNTLGDEGGWNKYFLYVFYYPSTISDMFESLSTSYTWK